MDINAKQLKMSAEEFLEQAWKMECERRALERSQKKIISEWEAATSITSHIGGEGRGGGNTNGSELKNVAYSSDAQEYEEEVKQTLEEIAKLRNLILRTIRESISDRRIRSVMIDRYINFMKWNEIANELCVTTDRVYQMRREGIRKIKVTVNYT